MCHLTHTQSQTEHRCHQHRPLRLPSVGGGREGGKGRGREREEGRKGEGGREGEREGGREGREGEREMHRSRRCGIIALPESQHGN